MSNRTSITAAAWATSGTATTGTTGLNLLTGYDIAYGAATVTHVGSSDVPTNSAANGFLFNATSGGSINFRVTAASATLGGGVNDYWMRFGMMLETYGNVTHAQTRQSSAFAFTGATGTVNLYFTAWRDTATNEQYFSPTLLITAGTGTVGALTSIAIIGENRWVEITVHMDIANGVLEVLVDGVVAAWATGLTVSGATGVSTSFDIGGLTNVKPRLAGPFEDWTGSDITRVTPATRTTNNFLAHQHASCKYGKYWDVTAATFTAYTGGGVNPVMGRLIASGSGTATTVNAVGTVVPVDGRYAFLFDDIYVPTGTLRVAIRDSGDTADLVAFDFSSGTVKDGAGTQLVTNNGVSVTYSTSIRYRLILTIDTSGVTRWCLIDNSTYFSARAAWDGVGVTLSTFNLGKIKATYSASTIEFGEVAHGDKITLTGSDSLTSASAVTTTPAYTTMNRIMTPFNVGDALATLSFIPNVCKMGFPRTYIAASGRSGMAFASEWWPYLGQYLTTGGIRMLLPDCSINDGVQFVAITGPVIQAAINAAMNLFTSTSNELWAGSVLRRPALTANVATRGYTLTISGYWRAAATAQAFNPRLFFADTSQQQINLAVQNKDPVFGAAGDQLHPDNYLDFWARFFGSLTLASAVATSSSASSVGSGRTTGTKFISTGSGLQ